MSCLVLSCLVLACLVHALAYLTAYLLSNLIYSIKIIYSIYKLIK